jgi:predicted RNA binding protein YcfA (HicA-like mRNA interferase family)
MRLKPLSGRDVVAALAGFGFVVVGARGSHCKLRRTLPSGHQQTLTIPLHRSLASGTLHAIYRQASRFVPEAELQAHFYSGDPVPATSKALPGGKPPRTRPDRPRRPKDRG